MKQKPVNFFTQSSTLTTNTQNPHYTVLEVIEVKVKVKEDSGADLPQGESHSTMYKMNIKKAE